MVDVQSIIWAELMKIRTIHDDPERRRHESETGEIGGMGRLAHLCERLNLSPVELATELARKAFSNRAESIDLHGVAEMRACNAINGGPEEMPKLLADASGAVPPPGDRVAWEAVRIVVKRLRERGAVLPPVLSEFLADAFLEKVKKPSSKTGTRNNRMKQDSAIIFAMYLATESGLQEYANRTTEGADTCVKVVSRVAAEYGITASPKRVENIWVDHKPRRRAEMTKGEKRR